MSYHSLNIDGELHADKRYRIIYATDASAYREIPDAVAFPMHEQDVVSIVKYAGERSTNLIPRAAGTSLAGQVVGKGIVVDISRHMNKILEINPEERWVRVQPGVVLDELNLFCRPYGLFFAPETSTSNRCCIGGMAGNNSCGSHSLIYGSTRDHVLEIRAVLADGSIVVFGPLSKDELEDKCRQSTLEGRIYRKMSDILNVEDTRKDITENFPEPSIRRRNSGYAIDELMNNAPFNFCKLIVGSEGTLAFITELKLNLMPLPPKENAVVCIHCSSMEEACIANLAALEHSPRAIELMDDQVLQLSKKNIAQNKNRFFIQGDPAAILIVELAANTAEELKQAADILEHDLHERHLGYHYSRVFGPDISRVWALRKAGLGLLSGMPGSAKPVSLIEDTAINPAKLYDFITDLRKMLEQYGLNCVFHGHISTGELHLRPILNLKEEKDRKLFRIIATETAKLVKKYKGSLSGEHGDGRLRGEFLPLMFGDRIYSIFKEIKDIWDEKHIFNQGKIVDTPPMDRYLRYEESTSIDNTYFDFSSQKGYVCAIEQCNGSGDCRKQYAFGGTMCPVYRATHDEKDTTRARANILRELIIHPVGKKKFSQPEILESLDSCLSCKACKAECPSNVDMARYKAEYLQHHYDETHVPLRSFLIANLSKIQKIAMIFPAAYNTTVTSQLFSTVLKKILRFAPQRTIPGIYKYTLRHWLRTHPDSNYKGRKVYLFADEFTNYMDVEIGITFVKLLRELGYNVSIPKHAESGRTEISKGLVKKARKTARKNVLMLKNTVSDDTPLVGIEPSCILSFRDEYPDLVGEDLKECARSLAKNCLLFDEFLTREIHNGNISKELFTSKPAKIKLHGHCHQKALVSIEPSKEMLSFPENYSVEVIPSGCCGMAGAFGYEKEHYELSMKIGEQVLFPAVRSASENTLIAAPGTSCRQQILDGTGIRAFHPVEILYQALSIKTL